jgi:predicted aldo/keto reductase-like oxidoreductase
MSDERHITTRRDFIQTAIGASAVIGGTAAAAEAPSPTRPSSNGLPTRPLGKTGVDVSILCLGGWHIGAVKDRPHAIQIMHAAIDEGITFFDNCWDYHDGGSEEVMGQALARDGKRNKVFLMTKNCERDHAGSLKNLEDSLRRLKTDHIDLWQFHEIIYDNDPEWVFEKGGLKAALEARKAGKVRFIGFTGHKDPAIHLKMLAQPHAWDTAQMPVNVMDAHFRSFARQVIPVCQRKRVGVIGMKSLGGGYPRAPIPAKAGISAEDCLRYALGQPIASLVVGITSMEDLRQDVGVARGFKPLAPAARQELLARAREHAADGRHELFKTSKDFDGPHHRKQHGFGT